MLFYVRIHVCLFENKTKQMTLVKYHLISSVICVACILPHIFTLDIEMLQRLRIKAQTA